MLVSSIDDARSMLKARVETNQARTLNLRNIAMDALAELINDIKAARTRGRSD